MIMLNPSEVNLKQRLFIDNFNLLAEFCTQLGEPIKKVSSDGLCDGLTKRRLFDAYQAKGGELPEFDAYIAYINRLTPKSIQELADNYITNRNFVIGFVADHELTFEQLLQFAQSVSQAQKLQKVAPFKSFGASWDDSLSFVCKKSRLHEFLLACQFDGFDSLHFGAGVHAFAKVYLTIYDANNPEKAWVLSASKTSAENAAEVASIISQKILAHHTQSDYVALSLNSLSYDNAHRELVDLLNENSEIIQQLPLLHSYIKEYERGKLSRMQLALILKEAKDSNNPNLIKLKNELNRICTQQTVTIEKLITLANNDINGQDSNGNSWLGLAVYYNQITWAKALLNAGATIDVRSNDGATPLSIAVQEGHLGIVKLLIAKGAKMEASRPSGATPLYVASQEGHLEIVKLLAETGAKINASRTDGATPLYVAAQEGHIEIIKLLVTKGANINAACTDGATPLYVAAQEGHQEIVKLLMAQGAKINLACTDGATPLYVAAQEGHQEIVKLLMAQGAKINAACTDGATPLYVAAQEGHLEIVKLLMARSAKINAACTDGSTPLYIAAKKGHLEIVKLLVETGAKLNASRTDGKTPLYAASQNNQLEIAKFLLEHGADIDAVCHEDGSTPFHVAAYNGDISMVTLFLEKGANINKPMKNGKTPLGIASCEGHVEIKQIIEQYKNTEAVLLQANAKIKRGDSVAVKISKIFSAFAYPPMFSMIWRNGQEKKCAAAITKELLENPAWSFNKCKNYVTTYLDSNAIDQWSVLAGLLKQLDKFAPEQAVSIPKNNPKALYRI